jgi:hypothetical protein
LTSRAGQRSRQVPRQLSGVFCRQCPWPTRQPYDVSNSVDWHAANGRMSEERQAVDAGQAESAADVDPLACVLEDLGDDRALCPTTLTTRPVRSRPPTTRCSVLGRSRPPRRSVRSLVSGHFADVPSTEPFPSGRGRRPMAGRLRLAYQDECKPRTAVGERQRGTHACFPPESERLRRNGPRPQSRPAAWRARRRRSPDRGTRRRVSCLTPALPR